jgi:predicted nucleic acid-binding protein
VIVLLDTSVILRVVLRQAGTLARFGDWERAYCSELLGVEARRVLDRLRLEGALDDAGLATAHQQIGRAERTFSVVRVTRAVLRRASLPMPTVTKTLDAIHLATALLLSERQRVELVFATHDAQQGLAARALGFDCIGL